MSRNEIVVVEEENFETPSYIEKAVDESRGTEVVWRYLSGEIVGQ